MPAVALASLLLLATQAGPPPDLLPLKKLRLYEIGVGYFERKGTVSGGRGAALPLPAGHLDDALKTLVILDREGEGSQVAGVAFESAVSEGMARAMAGLPLDAEAPVTYQTVLESMKGLDVELDTASGKLVGRVLQVLGPFGAREPANDADADAGDPAKKEAAPPPEPWFTVLVVGRDGGVRRIDTRTLRSIRPIDAAARTRIDRAVHSLSQRKAQTPHPLRVQVQGPGPVTLGYIAEAPVWRTSYRVILGDPQVGATLQAWALLHNDTDEDWKKVDVELVNGQPWSYLFPLAAPRYSHRALAEPAEALSTVPQLARTTADDLYGDGGEIGESLGVGGLGLIGTGRGGGGTGEGTIGLGTTGILGGGPSFGDLARFSQAETAESQVLFTYRLGAPLDLAAHHSALVPMVSHRVEAEAIAWFPAGVDQANAAVRLVNSTGQTLPAGTVSFFADGGFSGEAGLERLKPGERQFILYGNDLDVELTRTRKARGETLRQVTVEGERLVEYRVEALELGVALTNRSGRPRKTVINLDIGRDAEIEGAPELDFDERTGTPLVIVALAPKSDAQHTMRVRRMIRRHHPLADLKAGPLEKIAGEARPADAKTLRRGVETLRARARAQAQVLDLDREKGELEADLGRLREDLAAVGKATRGGASARKLGDQVLGAEARLVELRRLRGVEVRRIAALDRELREVLAPLAPADRKPATE